MKSKIFKIAIRIFAIISVISCFYVKSWDWKLFGFSNNAIFIPLLISTIFGWFVLETIGKILLNTETIIANQNKPTTNVNTINNSANSVPANEIERVINERFPNSTFKSYK